MEGEVQAGMWLLECAGVSPELPSIDSPNGTWGLGKKKKNLVVVVELRFGSRQSSQ